MTARLLIGDVHDRMAELEDGSYDLIVTSPPFLALRSYLPDGHPLKDKEIGSEATPAAFLDVMLALTAEWGRLLAPHGSIAIEIGDTYSGSGGAGGDYGAEGMRDGQERFDGSASRAYGTGAAARPARDVREQSAWPEAKSLAMIPELYAASLAYGRNLLTGEPSPAGRWRVRNFKPWIRSNPPVGALGDKERPATSYITVATRAVDRYFDLDAVRTTPSQHPDTYTGNGYTKGRPEGVPGNESMAGNPAGAPPLDWVHTVDLIIDDELDRGGGELPDGSGSSATPAGIIRAATDSSPTPHTVDLIIDDEIDQRAGKANGWSNGPTRTGKNDAKDRGGNWSTFTPDDSPEARHATVGARGVHIRRRLEAAGILTTVDALDVSPKGYKGAHYAVWPPELVKRLVQEMVPRRVCTTCGKPSRRITETTNAVGQATGRRAWRESGTDGIGAGHTGEITAKVSSAPTAERVTLGWSDCGHDTWRPGRILDPFAGSGTTLAVATGLGIDADGIDIDERNADLATERCGMFLEVTHAGQIPGQQTIGGAA